MKLHIELFHMWLLTHDTMKLVICKFLWGEIEFDNPQKQTATKGKPMC